MTTKVLKSEETLVIPENAVKCEKSLLSTTFNVMHSSEITKVLRELTQCVASEHDLLVPDNHDATVSRSDISCSELSSSTITNCSVEATSNSHTCADCGKQFSKRDFLQKHRIVHEEPRHRCVVCEKSFVREDKLKRHFVSIHSKSRPHVCPVCAKAFARKDKLKDHQKHHLTAGSSFLCLECRVPFVQKSDLNRHTRGAHRPDGGEGGAPPSTTAPFLPLTTGVPSAAAATLPTVARARRAHPRRPARQQQPQEGPADGCPLGLLALQPALTGPPLFPPQFPGRAPLPLFPAAPPYPPGPPLPPAPSHGHPHGFCQLSYCPAPPQHHLHPQGGLQGPSPFLPAHLYPYLHF